jgi:hypothetical protein
MYIIIILFFVSPIDRNIPISLDYSRILADMEELNEKKQRNIVNAIIKSNIISSILSTLSNDSFHPLSY